jgi:hypothetical protein
MEEYTDDMFENVQKCIYCPRPRWRYLIDGKYCEKCDKNYCNGLEADKKRCRLKKSKDKLFCNRNHSYMEDYTQAMIDNQKLCTGCKKWRYKNHFEDDHITCEIVCQKRKKHNRDKQRIIKADTFEKCQNNTCENYAQKDKLFCGVHRMDQLLVDAEKSQMKMCADYNRKCPHPLLPRDYPYSKCEHCRNKEKKRW